MILLNSHSRDPLGIGRHVSRPIRMVRHESRLGARHLADVAHQQVVHGDLGAARGLGVVGGDGGGVGEVLGIGLLAACLYKLGRNDDCDAALARAYNLIRGCYTDEQWNKWGEKRLEDYRAVYECMGLNEYKPCPY